MANKTLSNDFMQYIADEGAWKDVSSELKWTEHLLEKYQDKVDWEMVSENRNVFWTIPMLKRFKHRINWDKLSGNADNNTLTENCIDTFKNRWNWTELSSNYNFDITPELLEKYADKWNWERIINGYNTHLYSKGMAIEFYERYSKYIPVAELQNSSLWKEILKQLKQQIISEITA